MRVLVDTNVILDFLLNREPFFEDAESLFELINLGQVTGYVTATTLTDIFYIARKHTRNIEKAQQAIEILLDVMEVCAVNRSVVELAFKSGNSDFEDAIQIACAESEGLDAILTRDQQGFLRSPIQVFSIQSLKNILNGEEC